MFYRLYFLEEKMSDYLVKAIDKTKNLRLITVNAKDLVSEAQKDMTLGVHHQLY